MGQRGGSVLKMFPILFVCFSIFTSATIAAPHEDTLKLAFVVFRHGDRTPVVTYPNDPYKNYSWPDGLGALTNTGKLHLFQQGQHLHNRYKNIIENENFSVNDIFVKSSEADRCIMSASTLLAGMFPPNPKQVWNEDLNWQPIPIHPIPRSEDNLLAMMKKCDAYDLEFQNAHNSDQFRNLIKKNADLINYILKNLGQDVDNILELIFLYDILKIEESFGLKLPEWTNQIYPDKLRELLREILEIFPDSTFMRRMKGGVLLKDMIDLAEQKRDNKLNKKMVLYAAHDLTLLHLLRPLKFFDDLLPDFGATFILELHEGILNDFEVKMSYYENAWANEYRAIKLKGCDEPCMLTDFKKVLKPVLPINWEEECKIIQS